LIPGCVMQNSGERVAYPSCVWYSTMF